jgi:hypothetical protein
MDAFSSPDAFWPQRSVLKPRTRPWPKEAGVVPSVLFNRRYDERLRTSAFHPPDPLETFMSSTLVRSATTAFLAGIAAILSNNITSAQIACEPGVGGVITCPCANNPSGPGRGCNNSMNTGGARLLATGTPSLSADNILFQVSFVGTTGPTCSNPSNNVVTVMYEGTTPIASIPWGDGVLCCGGTYYPLNVQVTNGGMMFFPVPGTTGVSMTAIALGDALVAGSTRCYFAAYRDACPTFCTPSLRQKTNSWKLTWTP